MKKVIWFFLSAIPLLVYGILSFLFYFLFSYIILRRGWFKDSFLFSGYNFDATCMIMISIVSAAIFFLVWQRLKPIDRHARPFRFTFATVLVLAALAFVCQYLTTLVIFIISMLMPQTLENYQEMLDSVGMTDPGILLSLYTVIIGPIHEEILMRGATFSIAKKAFPFWAANLIQALMFGILHMNLMQGCYAFCLGLVLGYLAHRYHSLIPSCVFHIVFNLLGMVMTIPDNFVVFFACLALFSVLLVILLKFQKKKDPKQTLFLASKDPFLDNL